MVTKNRTRTALNQARISEQFKSPQGMSRRQSGACKPRKAFLIVCEGAKTEVNYFESFRMPNIIIKTVGGMGVPLSVVNSAIKLKGSETKNGYLAKDDEVWAVFDRDSFVLNQTNEAFSRAREKGINIAFSNEAFELWYLLHFEYRNTGISRAEFKSKLSKHLGFEYEKNNLEMYKCLLQRMDIAVENAKRLYESYDSRTPCLDRNPFTSVFKLVQSLTQHCESTRDYCG